MVQHDVKLEMKNNGEKEKDQVTIRKEKNIVAEAIMKQSDNKNKIGTEIKIHKTQGGQIAHALSNRDIDILFERLGLKSLDSLITKTNGEEIKELNIKERRYAALHFAYHWIGAVFYKLKENLIEVTIFDSAPSVVVHKEIEKWFKKVERKNGIEIRKKIKNTPK
eukprot:Tbor_TRINITY_DN5386_c1_g8::TRINITY_DN5386_c1_g8_i1::g.3941::m.3941